MLNKEKHNNKLLLKIFNKAYPDKKYTYIDATNPYNILKLYSHKFAKAFWGEENICGHNIVEPKYDYECNCTKKPAWQYHLQQMVLLDDDQRIKYLEKFL